MAHEHCVSCFNRQCTHEFVRNCPLLICPNECGAILHACKLNDHETICLEAFHFCINASYGCPHKIRKIQVGKHLSQCPASTVVCTAEWSRRVTEKHEVLNTGDFDPNVSSCNAFDIALALHDQCVVLDSIANIKDSVPETVHQPSSSNSRNHATYKDYQLMRYMETEKAQHFSVEDYSGYPYFNKNDLNGEKEAIANTDVKEKDKTMSDITDKVGIIKHGEECVDNSQESTFLKTLQDNKSNPLYNQIGNAILCPLKLKPNALSLSNDFEKHLYSHLAFKKVIEFLPRYDTKREGMYTIMCNCLLRRDEFCSHYRNFHCDFHSSVNGWFEERCPYAMQGCHFVRRRFSDRGRRHVEFDNLRSCMTVHWDSLVKLNSESHVHLLHLPWEVLVKIVSYLDSYSIGQLASTCLYLQNLCESAIKESGIVVMQWINSSSQTGFKWKVNNFQWLFTSKCSDLDKWIISDEPCMASHIVNCPHKNTDEKKYAQKQFPLLLSNSKVLKVSIKK